MSQKQLAENDHVCPWWLTFIFDNPARKLIQSPQKIMGDLLHTGDTALDIGCGMGYFTIGMAKLVGESGRVTAVDLQAEMLAGVEKRARRHGLANRIALHRATPNSLGLSEPVDFVLTFWMVHEVPNKENFLREVRELLKPGGRYLFVEPKIHVSAKAFQATVALAEQIGFVPVEARQIALSRAMLFTI
ncbi:MAG: class I SAM-dependent methyltransferase [Anaerolineales bacterium]|nr:class I SAM-dependent methyltransferase [Anaerolineales bacterium]